MKCAILAALMLLASLQAGWALTPDEVIRLKKSGVSDAVIQKMLEQESRGQSQPGPVEDKGGEMVYSAGKNNKDRIQRNKEHERWKEEKSMDALKGVVIDTRQYGNQPGK